MEASKIEHILLEYDAIVNALIFGSYANKTDHNLSDVDIAIETKAELDIFTLGDIISKLEVVTKRSVDLIILNELYRHSPLLAFNIYQNHTILFVKDKKAFDRFKENALHFYIDFKPVLDEQKLALTQRVIDGNIAKITTT